MSVQTNCGHIPGVLLTMSDRSAQVKSLIECFGYELLSYLLSARIDSRSVSDAKFTIEQNELIDALIPMMKELEVVSKPDQFERMQEYMTQFDPDIEQSFGRKWHVRCGGDDPECRSDDPLEQLLLIVARDIFAGMLLPNDMTHQRYVPFPRPKDHPKLEQIGVLLCNDPDTWQLLVDAQNPKGSAENFVQAILSSTACSPQRDESLLQAFLGSVSTTFNRARTLMTSGGAGEITSYVFLNDLTLAEHVNEVPVRNGRIRRTNWIDYYRMSWAELTPLVLEIERKVSFEFREIDFGPDDAGAEPTWLRNFFQITNRNAEEFDWEVLCVQLAILLASDDERLFAPAVVWETTQLPMSNIRIANAAAFTLGYHYNHPRSTQGSSEISVVIADSITNYSTLLEDFPKESLEFGVRRLLSAAGERADPADSLVDAVICLENAFGDDSGELSFRICGSLAKLIEPDDKVRRLELYKSAKTIYGKRSKIVHGTPIVQDRESAREAIRLGIRMYRALLSNPQILLAKDASKRNNALLLEVDP